MCRDFVKYWSSDGKLKITGAHLGPVCFTDKRRDQQIHL